VAAVDVLLHGMRDLIDSRRELKAAIKKLHEDMSAQFRPGAADSTVHPTPEKLRVQGSGFRWLMPRVGHFNSRRSDYRACCWEWHCRYQHGAMLRFA
jgi:hypothetical protein